MKTNRRNNRNSSLTNPSAIPPPRGHRARRTRVLQAWDEDIEEPVLRFTPHAWAKLHFFCHHGRTEIGGFGITDAGHLLCVEDFTTVRQETTEVSVAFDDTAVADFFDRQVDRGRKPEQFARIWLHTHPGDSPLPSSVDEETFARVFVGCEWAVMFILACGGKTYARLRFNVGPGGASQIPVVVDYSLPFGPSDHQAWNGEYQQHIQVKPVSKPVLIEDIDARSRFADLSDDDFGFSLLDDEEQIGAEASAVGDDWWPGEREG